MASVGDIIKPDEDIEIDYEFSGSIRCRLLLIKIGGSVEGSVVADRINVLGRFSGVADCNDFRALPPAVVRGSIFAPSINLKGKDGELVDHMVFSSSKRQSIFHVETPKAPLNIDEFISTAIDEAIADRVGVVAEAAVADLDVPVAVAEPAAKLALGLSDRLAAKGLSSMIPETVSKDIAVAGPVAAEAIAQPRAVNAARTPLPSLV